MPSTPAAPAAQARLSPTEAPAQPDAQVIELDEVAQRRERLAAYVVASRPVIVYRFVIAPDARVPGLGAGGEARNAAAQLELLVGLAGGGLTRSLGGLAARIPKISAARFETMAHPLIEAHLVSLDLGEGQTA